MKTKWIIWKKESTAEKVIKKLGKKEDERMQREEGR